MLQKMKINYSIYMAQILPSWFVYHFFRLEPRPAKPHVVQATVSAAAPVKNLRGPSKCQLKKPVVIIRLSQTRACFVWGWERTEQDFSSPCEYQKKGPTNIMYYHFLRLNLEKWDCNIHLPQFETTKGQTFDPSLATKCLKFGDASAKIV